jgi:hypothetical protein
MHALNLLALASGPLAASAAHARRRAQARAQVTAADARQRSDPDRRIFLAASGPRVLLADPAIAAGATPW